MMETKRMIELMMCANEQGFSMKVPGGYWLDLALYLELRGIANEGY